MVRVGELVILLGMGKEPTARQIHGFISKKFETIVSHLQGIQIDIRGLQKTQREHTDRFDEIDEVLGAVSRAVDKDAVTILEYGRRIARLERSR